MVSIQEEVFLAFFNNFGKILKKTITIVTMENKKAASISIETALL